ncbi:hypothetical protein AB5J62_34480 [Amycolatopsis sp. cg5]|uniref:hypothetical protein n=1 Tax=Amycolatopsis sp. cg5 TaxID=3238802 RepID=UPI0035253544
MTAGGEFRKALVKRLLSLIIELENLVHRHGYLRVFAGIVPLLGIAGLLGQLLGIAWLRLTAMSIIVLLLLLTAAVAFAGSASSGSRERKNLVLLHEYADALRAVSPAATREWRQVVTIESDGAAHVKREIVVDAISDRAARHIYESLVYYGSSPLSERDKRLVTFEAVHAGGLDPREGTRANATAVWTTTVSGRPKLDVYVHLGGVVEQGDRVTVRWRWPGYSADLMNGLDAERFDVIFREKVSRFEHVVIFRGMAEERSFVVRNQGAPNFVHEVDGADLVVRFAQVDPAARRKLGFVADFRTK